MSDTPADTLTHRDGGDGAPAASTHPRPAAKFAGFAKDRRARAELPARGANLATIPTLRPDPAALPPIPSPTTGGDAAEMGAGDAPPEPPGTPPGAGEGPQPAASPAPTAGGKQVGAAAGPAPGAAEPAPAGSRGAPRRPSNPSRRRQSTKTEEPSPAEATGEEHEPAADPAGEWNRKRTFYVPGAVLSRLRDATRANGMSYAEFVLDVFDRSYTRLDELFPRRPARSSPLPPRPPGRRQQVPDLTQMHLTLERSEWEVLERRRVELEVASLSELVSTMLEDHFGLNLSYRRPWRG